MEKSSYSFGALDTPRIDKSLNKFSQASVAILSGIAFVFNQPIIVLIVALALLFSAIAPAMSPFRWLYKNVAVPLHLLKPQIAEDDPAPHRFAQAIGATFLVASCVMFFWLHASVAGWTLDLIVFVLSAINFTVGFCAGCFVYFHLGRLGLLPRVRYEGSFHWRGV